MRKKGYILDKNLTVKHVERTALHVLKSAAGYLVSTVSLAILYYIAFALIINTDSQKALRKENRLYKKTYEQLLEREALIADVVEGLQLKDGQIYEEVFHTTAPALDRLRFEDYLSAVDTIPDKDIVEYAWKHEQNVESSAAKVEANFRRIMALCADESRELPPLSLPLETISAAQVGATVGNRMNPYYKVETYHSGLDLIAPQGDPVLAAADGTVTAVERSRKGDGNAVEITHKSGYVTRYAHLGDIMVSKGQSVTRGKKIATVGISGNSFAPHLHYEVMKDGERLDPVDFLFASLTPDEYADFRFMAAHTGQSLD